MVDVTDQYPSTGDLPPIMGAQDDAVLLMLEGAYKRYKRGGTADNYISTRAGRVCAIGALLREAGVTPKRYGTVAPYNSQFDYFKSKGPTQSVTRYLRSVEIENETIAAAKEAIKLLNKSAKKLCPASRDYIVKNWSGPLEYINQEIKPFSKAKEMVLKAYKNAIAERKKL